ncbi:hypothetical protein ILUMI_22741 [Ignelater luminosus]|uniref:PAX-interacting protein 1 n=1 Tax=Ignelater luminosus TaxID=2038154 RepID=A0A8K0CD96_IGNLU|nr:hypothetical protein ILUMI_22741 [Ignelater luminosus]
MAMLNKKSAPVTANDDDAIFMQSTEKYTNSQSVSRLEDKEDNEIFDQPTQVLVDNNKPIPSDNNSNEECEDVDEAIFMQPTQKYSIDDQNKSKQSKPNDNEIFKLPALITKDKKSVPKSTSKGNSQDVTTKSTEIQDDDVFNQPTQVVTTENVFDQPTQRIELAKDDKLVPSGSKSPSKEILENSPSEEAKPSLNLHKNTNQRNKFDEVESQLEVMFASQTLEMSLQANDRPSNPLVNVFDGKSSTEPQGNTEEIEIKEHELPESPQSIQSSTSTKEYCESSTLPMDELIDRNNRKETEASNAKQERPVRKRKVNETALAETVDSVETPKKRSLRNKEKVAIQEASTSTKKVNNKSSTGNEEKENITTIDDSDKQSDTNIDNEAKVTDVGKTRTSSRNKKQARATQKPNKKNSKNNEVQEVTSINETVETMSKNQSNTSEVENQEEVENIKSRAKRKPSKEAINETDKNETFKGNRTSTRKQKSELKDNGDDASTTVSTSRTLRNNKNESDTSVIPASSDTNANIELTPECIKPKNVNTRSTRRGGKTITSEETTEPVLSTPTRVSKRSKRLLSTDDDDNKSDVAAKRTKNIEMPANVASSSNSSNNSDFVSTPASTRSKRILNKGNEKGQSNQSVKKVKKVESPISEEANSDKSTTSIDTTPKRTKQQLSSLNITSSTLEKNRRILKPKVVFTMMNSPELESLIRSLGGIIVDSVSACTVLVTGTLKRSQKLLSAVGLAKPICSPNWLQECKKANKFLDPWDYILEDEEAERNWDFSLKESLERSKNKKLLEEYTVLLAVSEAVDVLKEAIESCGGKWVMKAPAKNTKSNFVVVGNPNKKASYARFLKQNPPPTVVAPEAIFDGVLRQELRFQNHLLT